jgi:calcineurin-like phosphoesterase family protein
MRYYIADCHFFHDALLDKMDQRGFHDVEEMNRYMIRQWNSRVGKRDEVIILGDLSMGNAAKTNEIIAQLRGKLYLVTGNHDNRFLKSQEFDRQRFEWIHPYVEMHDNKRKVILCHYPILCYNGQYTTNKEGQPKTYMLHGHVHDTHDARLVQQFSRITRETIIDDGEGGSKVLHCNLINCFCMYSDYIPLTLDEWIANRKEKE